MATTNREIIYTLKMRNEARAAIQSLGNDFRDAVVQAKRSIQEISRLDPFRDLGQSAQRARKDVLSATQGMQQAVNGLSSSIQANTANSTNAFTRLSTGATNAAKSVQQAMAQAAQATAQAYAAVGKNPTPRAPTPSPGARSNGNTPSVVPGATASGFQQIGTAISEATDRVRAFRAGVEEVAVAMTAYLAVREVLQLTDAYTSLQSQVKLVTSSMAEQKQTYGQLLSAANDNRQGIDSAVNLYTRMARASASLGIEQSKLMMVTDAVGKSMKLQAGNTQSMEAGVYQFTQGIASGTLRGDEFRSVMEQLPVLAQSIATGMNANIATLREMSEQGKLTSDVIVSALLSQYGKLKAEAAGMATTSAQAFTVLRNSMVDAVGRANEATGATGGFAQAILTLSEAIRSEDFQEGLSSGMRSFGAVLTGVTSIVQFAVEHFKALEAGLAILFARFAAVPVITAVFKGVVGAITGTAAAVSRFAAVLARAASIFGGLSAAAMGFSRIAGLAFGPWGVAISAASAAMYLLSSNTGHAERATNSLAKAVDTLRENYARTGDATSFLKEDDKARETAKLRDQIAELRKQKNTLYDDVFGGPDPSSLQTTVRNAGGFMPWSDDALSFTPIKKAYDDFLGSYMKGDGFNGVVRFREEIAKIGVEARNSGNGGLADMTKKVLDATKATGDHAQALADLEERLAYVDQKMDEITRAKYEVKIGIRTDAIKDGDSASKIFAMDFQKKVDALRMLNPDIKPSMTNSKELEAAQAKYTQGMNTLNAAMRTGLIAHDEYTMRERVLTAEYHKARDAITGLTGEMRKLEDARRQLSIDIMPEGRDKALAGIQERYRTARREAEKNLNKDDFQKYLSQSKADEAGEVAAIDTRINNLLFDRTRTLRDELAVSTLIGAQKERQVYWQQLYNEAVKGGASEENARLHANKGIQEYDRVKPQADLNQFRAGTLTDEIRSLREEAATLGMTAREKDRYTAAQRVADAARKAGIANSQEIVNEYLREYDAIQRVKESYNTFGQGFKSAMDQYLEETRNVANESKKLWTDVFSKLEDGLAEFIKTGKFSFSSFLDAIASDIARFAARQLMSQLFGGLFQQMFGGNPWGSTATGGIASTAGGGILGQIFGSKGAASPQLGTGDLTGSAGALLNARAMFANELANPDIKSKLFAMTEAEVGGQGPMAQQSFMESIMNRASARGMSIDQVLSDKGYFPKSTFDAASKVNPAAMAAKYEGIYGQVRQGSNLSGYATGNASGTVGFGKGGYMTSTFGNEKFGVEAADVKWARQMGSGEMVPVTRQPLPSDVMTPGTQPGLTSVTQSPLAPLSTLQPQVPVGLQPGARGLLPADPYKIGPKLMPHDPMEKIDGAWDQFKQQPLTGGSNGLGFFNPDGSANPMVKAAQLATPQIQADMNSAFSNVATTTQGTFQGSFSSLAGDFSSVMGQSSQNVATQFAGAFSGAGGAGGGGGGIFSWLFGLFGFHRGGIVGTSGSLSRSVSAAMFMGAPKFHSGGIVGGLSHGERPVIAKDGEAIMPTVRMPDGSFGVRALGGVGGGGNQTVNQTSINVSVGPSSGNQQADQEHANNIARQIDRVLDNKMAQWTQNQQRSGGIMPKKELYA